MTVLEVIQRSAEFLARKGVDSPRLQVELLLAHLLAMPRMKLYLNFERVLSEEELASLRELVKRRGAREPLQHIIGTANFCGLEFAVNGDVLIPRPETELLAERAWKFLGTREANPQASTALDFGTGTGCLAILLAAKSPTTKIHALDISEKALEVARANAARHAVADRICFLHGDGFSALARGTRFDLVISNPPYVATAEIGTLEPEVRDHDPGISLDGGADGLAFYRLLSEEAQEWLAPEGRLMVEFGEGQAEKIRELFQNQKWVVEAIEHDYTQRERFMVATR